MTRRQVFVLMAVVLAAGLVAVPAAQPPALDLGRPELPAPGVELYHLVDSGLVTPPAPMSVWMLRVDPRRVAFRLMLAQDTVLGTETVPDMARRAGALAAVNAGFFLPSGEPAGLLKIDGELVSDTDRPRGALALLSGSWFRPPRLVFDQVEVRLELDVARGSRRRTLRATAVDSNRGPTDLVWYTPRFSPTTRTPPDGIEWVLTGRPLRITARRDGQSAASIPPDGAVLSAGPKVPAATYEGLRVGDEVRPRPVYRSATGGSVSTWYHAPDVVGGAGLLIKGRRALGEWAVERLRDGFATERHPRTVVGAARDGRVWLIAVDGRRPESSVGMNFAELQGLAGRLGLVDALNLDGGGSTTMVVRGQVVNHPSDAAGPRRVSDALLIFERKPVLR